jgi:uncharacterized membrane protein YecN with MAPEG domain
MFDQVAQMVGPSITLTYGSILALIFVALSLNVSLRRGAKGISHGPGESDELMGIMRAQENFAEYVPLTLIVLAGLEMTGADATWLRVLGGSLVIARVLHAAGLIIGRSFMIGRAVGALGTLTILAGAAVWSLIRVLS